MDQPTVGKKYELQFSDLKMGHDDLGWMTRVNESMDDEDMAYARFLKRRGIWARVYDGQALRHDLRVIKAAMHNIDWCKSPAT